MSVQGDYAGLTEVLEAEIDDSISRFDSVDNALPCPFGADYCPSENPCPVHDEIVAMRESVGEFLRQTNFGKFLG